MAKIPKNRSDKDMMQGFEEEETLAEALLKRERQEAERARVQPPEPPADLARAGLTSAQTEELGRALLELRLTLAQEGVTSPRLKIARKGRQVIITAT
ncbi:hypothetical protein [uncultured Selenomonas sp.]|uniref:hypothetical protein n=1 Tax=uncultured Selenomonas sp. TaxID=159275 RepID=UPI0028D862B1|nr:hypothetical protein [uncultured Selenomonas sp.]